MLYQVRLTVPADTPADKPVEVKVKIEEPYLLYYGVKFPPGPSDMVYIAIYHGISQLFPSREGEWISGDNEIVGDWPIHRLPERPCTLRVKGYSPGTRYQHTVIVRFIAVEAEWVVWMRTIGALFKAFKRLLKLVGV